MIGKLRVTGVSDMSGGSVETVDVAAASLGRARNGLVHTEVAGLGELDQHGQVDTRKDLAVLRATGAQGQVRGGSAEHVGHDDNAGSVIYGICRIADFAGAFA